MGNLPILSWIIFLPLVGIIPLLLIDSGRKSFLRWTALTFALLDFVLSLVLIANFDGTTAKMQFTENVRWIVAIGSNYHVGVDGISILLVLLTTFMTVIAIASTWNSITEKVKGFMISFLIL
jgi:NADH-quinone oxidoreductase subunit M